jgi:hypothetical protein
MVTTILFVCMLIYANIVRGSLIDEPLTIIGLKNNLDESITLKIFKNDYFKTQNYFHINPKKTSQTPIILTGSETVSIESTQCTKTIDFNELKTMANKAVKTLFVEVVAPEQPKSFLSLLLKTSVNKFSLQFIACYGNQSKMLDETYIKKMTIMLR